MEARSSQMAQESGLVFVASQSAGGLAGAQPEQLGLGACRACLGRRQERSREEDTLPCKASLGQHAEGPRTSERHSVQKGSEIRARQKAD